MASDVNVDFKWDIPVLNRVAIKPIISGRTARVAERARQYCPVETGKMLDSITENVEDADKPTGHVTVGDPAYVFVAGGTAPHEEVPVNGLALTFLGKAGGVVFAANVNHPGTKPNPFLQRALLEVIEGGGVL